MTALSRRRAARVICLDARERVLLLHWQDPLTRQRLWEPPGGGVEAGESDLAAAGRELQEETGLAGALDESWAIEVERDFWWNGRRYAGPERFYGLALREAVVARPAELTASETGALLGYGWFDLEDVAVLVDRVEPPELPLIVASLVAMHRRSPA